MKEAKKKKHELEPGRVLWKDFVQTRAYRWTQTVLHRFKYNLVVVFDGDIATDVYVQKR